MIYFIVTNRNHQTINHYIGLVETSLLSKIKPIFYYQLGNYLDKIKSGTLIFSDIELLNELDRKEVNTVCQSLFLKPNLKILNHPINSMRRYELLNHLFKKGINDFRVYRITDNLNDIRFPVFLRFENDHSGNQSELIFNDQSLKENIKNINGLSKKESIKLHNKIRGDEEILITEFCDTSDKNGIIRKYSAFYFNRQIIPRHLFFGINWCLKYAEIYEDLFMREELEYIKSNPHQNELTSIFKMARIDYGRIDYGLNRDGSIQVWEINTNPSIIKRAMLNKKSIRYQAHQTFRVNFKREIHQLYSDYNLDEDKDKLISPRNIFFVYRHLFAFTTISFLARSMRHIVKATNSTSIANMYSNLKSFLSKPIFRP